VHVEELGVGRHRARGGELAGARDVEGANAGVRQGLQDEFFAVRLDRIGRLARERSDKCPGVAKQDARAKTVDGDIGAKRERGFVPGSESVDCSLPGRSALLGAWGAGGKVFPSDGSEVERQPLRLADHELTEKN